MLLQSRRLFMQTNHEGFSLPDYPVRLVCLACDGSGVDLPPESSLILM